MRLTALMTALLVALFAAPMFAQESTREDFRELCQLVQGRWVGDVTWVADWPGFGKRGEKVTAYTENKIAEDGNALISRFYGGDGSSTGLIVFDAGAEQIKSFGVSSGGGVGQSIMYKKGGKWVDEGTGSNPDGTKTRGTATLTITDNGNTHTWTGPTWVGEKRVDDAKDVFRRVSK